MDQLIHVDINQLIRALEQTLSPDQCLLDASYRFLEAVARDEDSFAWLTAALANLAVGSRHAAPMAASTLGNTRETALCQQAAIQLKNLVRHHGCRWLQLSSHQRSRTKTVLLGGLGAVTTGNELSDRQCSSALSQCIQAVAELELPHDTWPELLPQLVALIINNGSGGGGGDRAVTANMAAAVVASGLETLGFICETVSPACLEPHVNQLLTAVVYGMQEAAFPAAVNLAAVRALTPLLALATANFARRPERNYIMQVHSKIG
jgi:importin subunit beta-1